MIETAFKLAISQYQAGKMADAEIHCREILAQYPRHPDSLHLLGLIAGNFGRYDAAVDLIRQAIALSPRNPTYYGNLGLYLHNLGQTDEAIRNLQRALQLKDENPQAHFNLGNAWQSKGQLDNAIASYQKALKLRPDYAKVHTNLGNAYKAKGNLDQAIDCYERTLALKPDDPQAHNNLGNVWKDKGNLDAAINCYQHAITLKPDYAEAHNNLGLAWMADDNIDKAIACFQRALDLKPDFAEAYYNLGNLWREKKKDFDQAIVCYEQAIFLKPDFYEAHNNLGNARKDQGQIDQAIASYQYAIHIKPDYIKANNNLGNCYREKGLLDQAISSLQFVLLQDPNYAEAYYNLGMAWMANGDSDAAIICYEKARSLTPGNADIYNNLGNALKDKGRLNEAIASYQQALKLNPEFIGAHDNILFTMLYSPATDRQSLFREYQQWNHHHAKPLAKFIQPHANNRDADRRLRIGYVSPDFKNHAASCFILPLLASHNRDAFEIFCYAQVGVEDSMTAMLRNHADHWRNTVGISDEQVCEMVREDQIDILVDLAMHTADNRLLVFARKPAPVQFTYLAYAGGTAVDAIDYRLTDHYLDPDLGDDKFYMEKTLRLSGTYWCYPPNVSAIPVNDLPALSSEKVTFGCLNNFCKVSRETLDIWSQVLVDIPNSRLLMYAPAGNHRESVIQHFVDRGVDSDRLEIVGRVTRGEYFQTYHRIDIALDPFPYAGGTTTCDALWMGVPVITLAGRTGVGRAGVSILSNAGLAEFIAQSPEDYLRLARELAGDLPRLAQLRANLRSQLQHSPLMDAPTFARSIEDAYRTMWKHWCANGEGLM